MNTKRAWQSLSLLALALMLVACDAALLPAVIDKSYRENTIPPEAGALLDPSEEDIRAGAVTLSWAAATNDRLPSSLLSYRIVFSTLDNITSWEDAEKNGTVGMDWTMNVTTGDATGLVPDTSYYFNVFVRNPAGIMDAYGTVGPFRTDPDTLDPTPGGFPPEPFTNVAENSFTVSWTGGNDDSTPTPNLEYLVVYSTQAADLDTVENALSLGTHVGVFAPGITTKDVTGLQDLVMYHVTVIIRDEAGNQALYGVVSQETLKHDRIYWTEQTGDRIMRARLDGTVPEQAFSTGVGSTPYAIDIDVGNRKVYWSDDSFNEINVADMDGSNQRTIIDTNVDQPLGIAIDTITQTIYWSDLGNDMIYAAPVGTLDSDAANHVIANLVGQGIDVPRGITLDLTWLKLYWVESGATPRVRRSDLDGSNIEPVFDGVNIVLPVDIDVDVSAADSFAFWTDASELVVARGRKDDGANFSYVINSSLSIPAGITLHDNTTLFWTDIVGETICSAPVSTLNGDAADFDIVVTVGADPTGIALDD